MKGKNTEFTEANIKKKKPDVLDTEDPRFKHVLKDPRFERPKRKDVKITLDNRFASILKTKEFKESPKVDKYGRPISSDKSAIELERFYRLERPDAEEAGSQKESLELNDKSSEGSESDDDDDSLKEEAEEQIRFGEKTHRFAVVNLDWDNVKASDLMKLFNSFKIDGSVIKSVRIYPSQFGKERLEKEIREGPPKEVFKPNNFSSESNITFQEDQEVITSETIMKNNAGEEFDEELLRKYQLERLNRYYYAVVDCDTAENAQHIYQQCDGAEFERTANFLDLRFVPDDMVFDDEIKDECLQEPDSYKPVDFVTDVSRNNPIYWDNGFSLFTKCWVDRFSSELKMKALQHSNVKLTWDEDDPDRVRTTRQKFSKKDLDIMDFKAYLASSSEESSESDIEISREKLRNLLDEVQLKDQSDREQEIEITFTPGLRELTEETPEKNSIENETTIEAYKRKQRERKQKKKAARKSNNIDDAEEEDTNVDFDDPFFSTSNKPTRSKNLYKMSQQERAETDRKKAELELLVIDDEDNHNNKHFDMKEIIKSEKKKGRKKKRSKGAQEDDDQFEINADDPRFAALYNSHHFAIDPTNPHFKKTKAMSKLLEEQRSDVNRKNEEISSEQISKSSLNDPNLSLLINS
ncbi:18680_t:CDS:10 [Acaulospora morrowiae]|uniref:18680_t:CDS:1 n=1 Tax=Acaulospora morrowiae TaxID=94023 RepID=A0A9N9A7E3_9GLOM|nr:18680_t:CDS:10 [Acaulospora morrowiae]